MQSNFWNGKRVLIAGGAGFIGSHLAKSLVQDGALVTVVDNLCRGSKENLQSIFEKIWFFNDDLKHAEICEKYTEGQDIVMNLAAIVGGIGFNAQHNSYALAETVTISINLLNASRKNVVSRFLVMSSAAVYPKNATIPTPEIEGNIFDPNKEEAGYALAKYVSEQHAQHLTNETDMKIAIVRLFNCYGPRDNSDEKSAHVIPALIGKIMRGDRLIEVWGDGSQSRSFMYISDCIRGLKLITEKFAVGKPINWGNETEVTISELTSLLLKLSGRKDVKITFNKNEHVGHLRKCPDLKIYKEQVESNIKFVSLYDGLKETIRWYQQIRT